MQIGKYPEAIYRVSLKAVIRNSEGEVLVAREKGYHWSLPGGGIDHGESPEISLARELYEEVLIDRPFTYKYLGIDSLYVENREHWQMWIIYEISLKDGYAYSAGTDADEVAFIDPHTFKNSDRISEQLVYKWSIRNS